MHGIRFRVRTAIAVMAIAAVGTALSGIQRHRRE